MTERAHPRKVRSQIYSKLRTVGSGFSEGGGVRIEPINGENSSSVSITQEYPILESLPVVSGTSDLTEETMQDSPKLHIGPTSEDLVDHGISGNELK